MAMKEIFGNGEWQLILGILLGVVVLGFFGWAKFKRDERIVTGFLEDSGVERDHDERTTIAISSATRLAKRRVKKVCRKSSKIRKDDADKGSWKLHP